MSCNNAQRSMLTRPLLSAVIPTRNRARMVCGGCRSALCQRHGEVEVIVVDDRIDPDDTANVLARTFASRIRLVGLPQRAGRRRRAKRRRSPGERRARGVSRRRRSLAARKLDAELRVFEALPGRGSGGVR